jgi:hypothetical protein
MSRVHGTIERPVCMRTFALQPDGSDNRLPLAIAAFQPATGHSNKRALNEWTILPEPESRYGLSLAHNDACATIARSMFLACTFVSLSKIFASPFDTKLSRSVRFRGRSGAMSTPDTRFPRRSPTLPIFRRSPLPLGSSFESPPDRSVQPVPDTGSSPRLTPDCPSLPAASSFDSAADQCSELAVPCSAIVP